MSRYFSKGAIHIHTLYSDGTENIEKISKYALNAGLDWIIITDHNTMQVKEGIYNGVVVLTGEEITPPSADHYLAIGINETIAPCDNPQIYVDKVREQGGFGITAHPDESESRKNKQPPLIWEDKSITGDCIELWNWFSDWADNFDDTNIFTRAYAYFFRHGLIKGPAAATIKRWDEINSRSEQIFPATAGIDAHALIIRQYIIPLRIFHYKVMLNTLRNIINHAEEFEGSFEHKKSLIINALKSGQNVMYNKHICALPPEIYIENNSSRVFTGGSIKTDENTYLNVSTPDKSLIKVYLNGFLTEKTYSDSLKYKIVQKGKYRVEIYVKNNPWAFSNPILSY